MPAGSNPVASARSIPDRTESNVNDDGPAVLAAWAMAWVVLLCGVAGYVASGGSHFWFAVWLTAAGYLYGDLTLFTLRARNR